MENNDKRREFGPIRKKTRLHWGKVGTLIIGLAIVVAAAIFFIRGGFGGNMDDAAIIERVGKLIVLPANETPNVLTVSDADSMVSASGFYTGVKNDDKILIYPKAAKIFIYHPSKNILINVGPILDDSPAPEQSTTVE